MHASYLTRAVSLLVLVPLVLAAQGPREHDPVPLKHWSAPLYWQPTPARQERSDAPLETTANLPSGGNALVFVAMTPCRVVDTRGNGFTAQFGPPSLAAGLPVRTIPIQSSSACPVPSIAQAYSFNVTVVPPGPLLYLTLYPATANPQPPPPNVSTLNAPLGNIVANAAVVPAGTDSHGGVDVFASGPTDLIIDINGYYAPPGDLQGNTALGTFALANNTTGTNNTASGLSALQNNTTGNENTASGWSALASNTTGSDNTASGFGALYSNTTGGGNTAGGAGALNSNTTGGGNTASGVNALVGNTTGSFNTAGGFSAMTNNTTGVRNTAIGDGALQSNTNGSYNIAVGNLAAYNVSSGNSYNIHIGSQGAAGDSGAIRIGTPASQTSFFVAGVRGVTTANNDAIPVVIDSTGQLGTVSSSRRFKEDIRDMGDASSGLLRLRPVTFRYRQPFADGSKPIEYGLIAEEVAGIYPDLVARSADGQVETVKYQVLDSMLLNELQKQAEKNRQQAEQIRSLEDRLAALEALLSKAPAPAADRP